MMIHGKRLKALTLAVLTALQVGAEAEVLASGKEVNTAATVEQARAAVLSESEHDNAWKRINSGSRPSITADAIEDDELKPIDDTRWQYNAQDDIYWQVGIPYCTTESDREYHTLGIFVPGEYMRGHKNADGTYTVKFNDQAHIGMYSGETAPIVIPVETPGHAAMHSPADYVSEAALFTASGMVYVRPGCRGREQGVPSGLVDLKAVVRFMHFAVAEEPDDKIFNSELRKMAPSDRRKYRDLLPKRNLPGNTNRIFVFGMSGGGAQAALLGATGNSRLYDNYLRDVGAAWGYSDAVAGVMTWCPITNLDAADGAYEWNMGATRQGTTEKEQELSRRLANIFARYQSALGFRYDSVPLYLLPTPDGMYRGGTYPEFLKHVVEYSLDNYVNAIYPVELTDKERSDEKEGRYRLRGIIEAQDGNKDNGLSNYYSAARLTHPSEARRAAEKELTAKIERGLMEVREQILKRENAAADKAAKQEAFALKREQAALEDDVRAEEEDQMFLDPEDELQLIEREVLDILAAENDGFDAAATSDETANDERGEGNYVEAESLDERTRQRLLWYEKTFALNKQQKKELRERRKALRRQQERFADRAEWAKSKWPGGRRLVQRADGLLVLETEAENPSANPVRAQVGDVVWIGPKKDLAAMTQLLHELVDGVGMPRQIGVWQMGHLQRKAALVLGRPELAEEEIDPKVFDRSEEDDDYVEEQKLFADPEKAALRQKLEFPAWVEPQGHEYVITPNDVAAEKFVDSLNQGKKWVTYDPVKRTSHIDSYWDFVTNFKLAKKGLGAFDQIDRGQTENELFGLKKSPLHFSAQLAEAFSDQPFAAEFAADFACKDEQGNDMDARMNMYNPMYFISSYYDGYGSSDVANFWRIRSGIEQGDTALSTETNLALALKAKGASVDFGVIWVKGHVKAENVSDANYIGNPDYIGDPNYQFIEWVNKQYLSFAEYDKMDRVMRAVAERVKKLH